MLGGSAGYGLASRLVCSFGYGADTLSVALDRAPSVKRTGSPGWYHNLAIERAAARDGIYARWINADAFSDQTKEQVLATITAELGQLDLVVYSVASPRRTDSKTGLDRWSVLKPIGRSHTAKSVEGADGKVSTLTVEPATPREIDETVAVMGGEDWESWIRALAAAQLLAPGALTLAYSYRGPDVIRPIYGDGTIGRAKQDLEARAEAIQQLLDPVGGRCLVAVNKGLLTQASCAIPFIPLYIRLMYSVMKQKRLHEECLDHIVRLFRVELPAHASGALLRMDDRELRSDVQEEIERRMALVNTENLRELGDQDGYRREFLRLFGFEIEGVDYRREVDPTAIV